jgi:hypothetical protein
MTSSPFVIGLVGCKNVGKTTVARMIKKKWNFPEYTFAEPIKEICKIAFLLDDWQVNDQTGKETLDERWNTTPRKLLQTVGTNLFRDCYNTDHWLHHMDHKLDKTGCPFVVISDVRFQNEATLIKNRNGILIRISRDTQDIIDNHESEQGHEAIQVDDTISNNTSIKELQLKVDGMLEHIFASLM